MAAAGGVSGARSGVPVAVQVPVPTEQVMAPGLPGALARPQAKLAILSYPEQRLSRSTREWGSFWRSCGR